MSSFDTTQMNLYLVSVLSLAVIAVILAIAVLAYELACQRSLRPSRAGRAPGSLEGGKPVRTAVGCR